MSHAPQNPVDIDVPLNNFSHCHAGILRHLDTFGELPAWQCEKLFSGTSVSTGLWGAWLIVGSGLGGVAVPQRTAGVASVVHGPHARAPVS